MGPLRVHLCLFYLPPLLPPSASSVLRVMGIETQKRRAAGSFGRREVSIVFSV